MNVPKPLFKVGIGCLVVLLTCVGGVGFMAWRILGGEVKPTTDYAAEINALVESYQKEAASEPDAWNELQELLARSQKVHEAMRRNALPGEYANAIPDPTVLRAVNRNGGEADVTRRAEIRDAVRLMHNLRSDDVFAGLDALSQRRHIVRPLQSGNSMLVSTLNFDVSSTRQLARANTARYHDAVVSRDYPEALRAFESGLALARFCMQQGFVIDRLVGVALTALNISVMLETVHDINDVDALRGLMAALERQTAVPPIALSFHTQQRYILDTMQWTFTDVGDGNGYITPAQASAIQSMSPVKMPVSEKVLGVLAADRKDTTAALQRYIDQLVAFSELPRPERAQSAFQPNTELENLSQRYVMLKVYLQPLGRTLNSEDQFSMEIAAARTVLGVEIWRRENEGRPPATLSQLVPGVFKEVPMDPISGKPFGLKLIDHGGATGTAPSYMIYSFAGDGVDDGGNETLLDQSSSTSRYGLLTQIPAPRGFDFVVYPVKPSGQ